MSELAAALFGFIVGGFVAEHFLYWVACLWMAADEYRIAVRYPHLGRRKRLFVFLPLLLLHAGPWAVLAAAFVMFELFVSQREAWHFWFLGGFLAHVLFMLYVAVWITRKVKKSTAARDARAPAAERGR